jgi:hypothetical protein
VEPSNLLKATGTTWTLNGSLNAYDGTTN